MTLRASKFENALDRLLGISRVARVTGLDRSGVEVACAIRPGGHVLQVCNGKGDTWAQAALGARMETAELWAAERVDESRLRWSTAARLEARTGERAVAPQALDVGEPVASEVHTASLPCAFIDGTELFSGRRAWVPAWAVHCPPQGGALLGVALAPWSTNGMGAHRRAPAALAHALLEAAERHVLAKVLPEGWTEEAVDEHLLSKEEVSTRWPELHAATARMAGVSLRVLLFNLTPAVGQGPRVPTAGALLIDEEAGPMPLAAGYASASTLGAALRGALLEAAQSRLTDIHGAREDVAPQKSGDVAEFVRMCAAAQGCKGGGSTRREGPPLTVPAVMRQLWRAGIRTVVAVELAPVGCPFHVIKLVAPELEVSFLL